MLYGYRIKNGHAVIDHTEAERLIAFFRLYASGAPLLTCTEKSGIARTPQVCKSLLSRREYLGEDPFFPPIIPPALFRAVEEEMERRARNPTVRHRQIPDVPVQTRFIINPSAGKENSMDPGALYRMIVSRPSLEAGA